MNTNSNLILENDSVLVVVDMQTVLLKVMPTNEMHPVITHSKRLIEAAQLLEIPVLVTEQYPVGLGLTLSDLTEVLATDTPKFHKTVFSCCAADGFMNAIESTGRKQVTIVGMEAHVCVLQTAMDLQESGFQVYITEDAIISRNSQNKANALQRMSQNNITITNFESVILEWLKDSKHPHFKTISGWLKS